jgi:hypothetical protein
MAQFDFTGDEASIIDDNNIVCNESTAGNIKEKEQV